MAIAAIHADDLNAAEVPNIIAAGVIGAVTLSSGLGVKIGRWFFGG